MINIKFCQFKIDIFAFSSVVNQTSIRYMINIKFCQFKIGGIFAFSSVAMGMEQV